MTGPPSGKDRAARGAARSGTDSTVSGLRSRPRRDSVAPGVPEGGANSKDDQPGVRLFSPARLNGL